MGAPRATASRRQFPNGCSSSGSTAKGRAGDGGSAPHLDCRAVREDEQEQVEELLKEQWLGEELEERARTIAMTQLVPRHVREVRERRVPRTRPHRVGGQGADAPRDHASPAPCPRTRGRRACWKKPRLNSKNVRRQCDALSDRLTIRLAEVARQRDIASLPPEICGAALVIPGQLLDSGEAEDDGVIDPADAVDAATRAAIEALGMNAVMERERLLGHEPRDVSAENRGYDIEGRAAIQGGCGSSR